MHAWLKALHLIFMVTWFAGLFYLPRLFVYHALTADEPGKARFKLMERKLYRGIMAPAAILTLFFGAWLTLFHGFEWFMAARWLHLKLAFIGLLLGYHFYLGALVRRFAEDANTHGDRYYRWLNEAPVVALIAIILLAVLKPF